LLKVQSTLVQSSSDSAIGPLLRDEAGKVVFLSLLSVPYDHQNGDVCMFELLRVSTPASQPVVPTLALVDGWLHGVDRFPFYFLKIDSMCRLKSMHSFRRTFAAQD
jgi:hypothetical protein